MKELDNILRSPDYSPEKLIEFFKNDFSKEFAADAGVWERYTLERHTLMVLNQFEKYFSCRSLPCNFNPDAFRVILTLHDIGVPTAIEEGTKHGLGIAAAKKVGQAKYTSGLLEATMKRHGFNRKEINVAKALVSDDPIGNYLKSGVLTTDSIRKMALKSGMSVMNFLDLILVFFMVDAGGYTKDAGGKKSLDFLFVFDKHNMKMQFSSEVQYKINRLKRSLE